MAVETQNWGPAVEQTKLWLETTDFNAGARSRVSPAAISGAMKIFLSAGLLDDVIAVLDEVPARGGAVNLFHWNIAIKGARQHKRFDEVVVLFDRMLAAGLEPDKYSVASMIPTLAELRQWDRAKLLYNGIPDSECDEVLRCSILQCAVKCARVSEALELFEGFPRPRSAQQFNSVISLLGAVGRWKDALDCYHVLLREAGEDRIALFTILRVLEKAGLGDADARDAAAQVKLLSRGGGGDGSSAATPDASMPPQQPQQHSEVDASGPPLSLNHLLAEARRSGAYKQAVEAADKWLAATYKHGHWSPAGLTQVTQIFGEANRVDRLVALLEQIESLASSTQPWRGPGVRNLNVLMAAFTKSGRPDLSLRVFAGIPAESRDGYSFGSALLALERQGNVEEAEAVLRAVDAAGLPRTPVMVNTMLALYGKAGLFERLVTTFRGLGPHADEVSRRVVLAALEKGGQVDTIAAMRGELFPTAARKPAPCVRPSKEAEVLAGGDADVDVEEVDEVDEEGGVSIRVLAQMPALSKAGTLFQKLMEKPSAGGISGVVKLYAMSGHIDAAIDMVENLGPAVNPITLSSTYNAILLAASSIGDWESAYNLFDRMVEKDVPRTMATYRYLMHVLQEYGDEDCVREVEVQAKVDGISLQAL